MKSKTIVLMLALAGALAAQDWDVRLIPAPPTQFFIEYMWNCQITNTETQSVDVTIYAWVEKDGTEIAHARSNVMTIPAGGRRITSADVRSVQDEWYDPAYEGVMSRRGALPAGIYAYCIRVEDAESREVLAQDCGEHRGVAPSPPKLIAPPSLRALPDPDFSDEVVQVRLTDPYPTFVWTPPIPLPEGVTYGIRIVEVPEPHSPVQLQISISMTPEEAISAAEPWFEQDGLTITSFTYPMSARPFAEGEQYAWQVTAFVGDLKIGESETWVFQVAGAKVQPQPKKHKRWGHVEKVVGNKVTIKIYGTATHGTGSEKDYRYDPNAPGNKEVGKLAKCNWIEFEYEERKDGLHITAVKRIKFQNDTFTEEFYLYGHVEEDQTTPQPPKKPTVKIKIYRDGIADEKTLTFTNNTDTKLKKCMWVEIKGKEKTTIKKVDGTWARTGQERTIEKVFDEGKYLGEIKAGVKALYEKLKKGLPDSLITTQKDRDRVKDAKSEVTSASSDLKTALQWLGWIKPDNPGVDIPRKENAIKCLKAALGHLETAKSHIGKIKPPDPYAKRLDSWIKTLKNLIKALDLSLKSEKAEGAFLDKGERPKLPEVPKGQETKPETKPSPLELVPTEPIEVEPEGEYDVPVELKGFSYDAAVRRIEAVQYVSGGAVLAVYIVNEGLATLPFLVHCGVIETERASVRLDPGHNDSGVYQVIEAEKAVELQNWLKTGQGLPPDAWHQVKEVENLEPGNSQTVIFEYQGPPNTYLAGAVTRLSGDENPANDFAVTQFSTQPDEADTTEPIPEDFFEVDVELEPFPTTFPTDVHVGFWYTQDTSSKRLEIDPLEYGKRYDLPDGAGTIEFIKQPDGKIKLILRCNEVPVKLTDLTWTLNGKPLDRPVLHFTPDDGCEPGGSKEIILENPLGQ